MVADSRILCGTVYNPPKAGFWSDVEEAIVNCSNGYDFSFLMGDFNIEWHAQSSSRRTLADSLVSCCLEVLPFTPTHHTDEVTHSTIDYICVSDLARVSSFEQILIPGISKHDVLRAFLCFALPCAEPTSVKRRDFRNFKQRDILVSLAEIDWRFLYLSQDIDFKVEFFTKIIVTAYDVHAPYRVFTPRKRRTPWISSNIKSLISNRDKAWKKYKKYRRDDDGERYRSLRNLVKRTVRNARYSFFKDRLSRCPNSAEKWRVLRELGFAKMKDRQSMPASPDAFNKHFIGAPGTTLQIPLTERSATLNTIFDFRRVDAADVLKAINSATSNAQGADTISLRHLRDCLPVILNPLVNIIDSSFRVGYFPAKWKHALVRPLPKTNSPQEISGFRPVSILNSPAKLHESVALQQISEFVEENNLLNDFQSGFRKGHSTSTAVTRVVDDLRAAINKECITLLVGIDFSRAFDLVHIELLIHKLFHLGFSDRACSWVRSYLSNRSQVVVFPEGESSSPLLRSSGVPQGSLPGPLLFSLFINDLPDVLESCKYQHTRTILLSIWREVSHK